MKERGILFSAPMVRALLVGAKTQTRRVVKVQPTVERRGLLSHPELAGHFAAHVFGHCLAKMARCPYGSVGDRLWVRETHAQFVVGNSSGVAPQCVAYRATCDEDGGFTYVNDVDSEIVQLHVTKWTPAIHMPRWASRLTLELVDVRVHRLHEISEDDARAEGIEPYLSTPTFKTSSREPVRDYRRGFERIWHEINGADSWKENPWVWALTFKRVEEFPEARR